jgi:membrane-associated phospholipid phosphatase
VEAAEQETQDAPSGGSKRSALIGFVVFCAATAILIGAKGVPLNRETIFLWVLVGLLAVSAADLRGWARGMIVDWLPFFAALFAYDVLRGQVGNDPLFSPHIFPQIRVDEFLSGGTVPSVSLQHHFYDPGVLHWYDVIAWATYLSHFFVVFAVAGVLWRFAKPRFIEFRAMVLTLTAAAFLTYALFPAVPPWMASDDGAIGPVTRVVGGVWEELGVHHAAALWEHGSTLSNEVAAIPSLHTAYPVMLLCFFWSSGWRPRIICFIYALLMSTTLVYTGEHYVTDVLLGWIFAIATYFAVRKVLDWRAVRARARAAVITDPGPLSDEARLGW